MGTQAEAGSGEKCAIPFETKNSMLDNMHEYQK
jgi:hypothetical protein